jgi:hypothetical protein
MTKIEFDEPSTGNVSSGSPALKINCTGLRSNGIVVESLDGYGVYALVTGQPEPPRTPAALFGRGPFGVIGQSARAGLTGVVGQGTTGVAGTGRAVGVRGIGPIAGRFEGNVEVTGDISLLNADCAEDFDIVEENVEAGTVMILNEMGSLQPSYQEYDKKVAGIISGASGYKPAIVLNRQSQSESENQKKKNENKNKQRLPIALMGKVYCKVDASRSSIEIGDLLTTSSTKGYAMKAGDPTKAFGAVIGKALSSIKEGVGMIPVLVTLQ